MGADGQRIAAGGEEPYRIVAGRVNANGGWLSGTGISSARTGAGRYTLTFITPFLFTPAVNAWRSRPVVTMPKYPTRLGHLVSSSRRRAARRVDRTFGVRIAPRSRFTQ
jgi:hypothetical protein